MDDPSRGIVYYTRDGTLAHLPLTDISIGVYIVDVSAHITLKQTFCNTTRDSTPRGKYVFPIPARAAVCGFEMRFADGRVIKGVCKEKEEAANEYAQALQEGKTTALVEEVTDDTFTISIGSIPPRQKVVTQLTFVMDLMTSEAKDAIRLQLPMSIGSRYGPEPPATLDAVSPHESRAHQNHHSDSSDNDTPPAPTRLRITASIQTSQPILSITSPSHPIHTSPYISPTSGKTSRRRKTVTFRSPTFLTCDWVLVVRAEGLDAPRCFAERSKGGQNLNGGGSGRTIAMQLTLVPKIELPPIPKQEYLFVIDRSGSMSGGRIEVAKKALLVLLRLIPNANSTFNIISFGWAQQEFRPQSVNYSRELDSAAVHVSGMDADLGGTELGMALQYTFDRRNRDIPTVVFLLTDGEINDPDPTKRLVSDAVSAANPNAPLRVFCLGIGNEVSSDVIESIARLGNGECLFTIESEQILAKCLKLFRAGRATFLENISIDWGVAPSTPRTPRSPPAISFTEPDKQQSPPYIEKIYRGMRFVVFAIILAEGRRIPKEVVLRWQYGGGDGSGVARREEVRVPVSDVRIFEKRDKEMLVVHTLAARRLITDAEDGVGVMDLGEEAKKQRIVKLGKGYQLASKWTSFVAVDDGRDDGDHRRRREGRVSTRGDGGDGDGETGLVSSVMSGVMSVLTAALSLFQAGGTPLRGRSTIRHLPGDFMASPSLSRSPSRSPAPGFLSEDEDEDGYESTSSFSTMSSLEGWSSDWSAPSRRDRPVPPPRRSPSPPLPDTSGTATSHFRQQPLMGGSSTDEPVSLPPEVFNLVLLQSFDGSFALNDGLGKIVGASALTKPTGVGCDDVVWATAVAVAYLRRHAHGEMLEGLLDKALEYVKTVRLEGAVFNSLVEQARAVL